MLKTNGLVSINISKSEWEGGEKEQKVRNEERYIKYIILFVQIKSFNQHNELLYF